MSLGSFNLSVGVVQFEGVVKVEGNKITGVIGDRFDRLIFHKNKRNAILKSLTYFKDDNIDPTFKNESFVGMVRNNLADIYSFPQECNYENELLEKSSIVSMEPFRMGHLIPKSMNEQTTDLSTFLLNNKLILFILLIGYLIVSLFNYLFIKNNEKIKNLKINFKFFIDYHKLSLLSSKVANIVLFFNIFIFLNLNVLTNTIKTDKVIVNTDEILNSNEKLLETDRTFVFYFNEEDVLKFAPKNSFLFKFYDRKVNKENNYFRNPDKKTKEVQERITKLSEKPAKLFILGKWTTVLYCFHAYKFMYTGDEYLYLNKFNFFENLNVIYMAKSIEPKIKKLLHYSITQYIESGFYAEFYEKVYDSVLNDIKLEIRIYFYIKDYINDHTIVSNFEFQNFRNIFIYFILSLIAIVFIFIINRIYKRLLIYLDFRL